MAGAVEIEISRPSGQPIRAAAPHPKRHASSCEVKNGTAVLKLEKPCQVTVDIDGQMDAQDTGKGYKGPPIHTISLFANPILEKPKPEGAGVFAVKPGQKPPTDGDWHTLYFLPGVHEIGQAYPLRPKCQYYLPGDALVHGTLCSMKWSQGNDIRVFGHGTLSGARIKHPHYAEPSASEDGSGRFRPLEVLGARNVQVQGITIADSPTHSLMLIGPRQENEPNRVQWTKIITWRRNGDGINPFGNTLVEDCFLRTQDDSLYVNGLGIRRCVLWNDANGSALVLSSLHNLEGRPIVVEDCDVIYSRASWHHWSGGRVFNIRGEGDGAGGKGVVFRNINIEDPRPTLQQFFLCVAVPPPYGEKDESQGKGDLSGILFQNIHIAAPSVLGEPQLLWGSPKSKIHGLTFQNLTVGGKRIESADFFKTNDHVHELKFMP
jgi:hypothetical protein